MDKGGETSRERILNAATAEFAAYGLAGARVDRIARAAECNKNLIYIYYENKETLFTTVLQKHLLRVYDEIPFSGEDLPGYAAATFDFAMANPDVMRLLAWFALEQRAAHPEGRMAIHDVKVAAIAAAQEAGKVRTEFPPEFLVTAIMTLATAWSAASPFGATLDPESLRQPEELRRRIGAAIASIAAPTDD
ncbi:MAG TPA: TetR family transcriptional regulator [Thermomicrobiales bacterium]|nr:TetR family transcriptional regulator [Thermomicrobiales bacterium]